MLTEIKKYFAETPQEEIRKSWESLNHLDEVGPLVRDVFDDWQTHYFDFCVDDGFYLIETNEPIDNKTLEFPESFFLYSSNGSKSSSIYPSGILL